MSLVPSSNPVAGRQRVLFVGQNSPQQDSLKVLFEARGFRVDVVSSAEEACKRLAILPSHAVILDLDETRDGSENSGGYWERSAACPPPRPWCCWPTAGTWSLLQPCWRVAPLTI